MKRVRRFARSITGFQLWLFMLALALLLAACDSDNNVVDPDWCYTFNYLTNDYQTNIIDGSWISGQGLVASEAGDLRFSYTHDKVVGAAQVIITAGRAEGVEGVIMAAGNGIIFGITPPISPFALSLAAETDVAPPLVLNAQGSSDSGTTMNISIASDKQVRILSIELKGWGVNPFVFNECPKGTPTVTASPTNIATGAPTVEASPTATDTLTPSITPTQGACLLPSQPSPTPDGSSGPTSTPYPGYYEFDFRLGDALGWLGIPGGGATPYIQSGVGWRRSVNSGWTEIRYEFDPPVYVSGIVVQFNQVSAASKQIHVQTTGGNYQYYGDNGTGANAALGVHVKGSSTTAVTGMTRLSVIVTNVAGNSIQWVRLYGYQPIAPTPTPTPWPDCTSTPTITPSVSPTPTTTPTPFTLTPTFTRTPTVTPFPIIIPTIAPTRTPTNTPHPSMTPSATAPPPPTNTLAPGITPTGTVGPFAPPGGEGSGIGDPTGLGGLVNGIIALGSNVWQRATGWAGNMAGAVGGVTGAWASAPPTAIPFLPQCRTNPTSSQLCAIWYILQWTVFAGGLGGLLIPVAVAVVDLYIVLRFALLARALLSQAKEIRK